MTMLGMWPASWKAGLAMHGRSWLRHAHAVKRGLMQQVHAVHDASLAILILQPGACPRR